LLHEAQVAAQFEHAGVIRILDVDLSLGAIVMEWVQGGALKQMVAREGDSFETRRDALFQVCDTLIHLHERGWVHRDIKPSNILLRSSGIPVISDFGLARKEGSRLEMVGPVGEGSLGFMPPEQARSGPVHRSADVFSFGATAAKLFRGMGELVPAELANALLQAVSVKPLERVNLEQLHRALSRAE
jgi:serine/threonine-protein kinase